MLLFSLALLASSVVVQSAPATTGAPVKKDPVATTAQPIAVAGAKNTKISDTSKPAATAQEAAAKSSVPSAAAVPAVPAEVKAAVLPAAVAAPAAGAAVPAEVKAAVLPAAAAAPVAEPRKKVITVIYGAAAPAGDAAPGVIKAAPIAADAAVPAQVLPKLPVDAKIAPVPAIAPAAASADGAAAKKVVMVVHDAVAPAAEPVKNVVPVAPAASATGAVPASALVVLYSYLNNRYKTHAYCSTPECTDTVQGRGFTAEKSARGRVIAPTKDALAAAKAACPGVEFVPLGFPKKRQGYTHNLEGFGLQAGYVTTEAKCGAKLGMKVFNGVGADDIWYTTGSSKRIKQNGGKPVFYVWEA